MRTWSRPLAVAAAVSLTAALAAGCSSDDGGTTADGKVSIVASTDVWGSVAAAVAGDKAEVTSLYNSPTGDPHEFEPNAQDTAKVSEAGVVVLNGGHYDTYMEDAPKSSGAVVINAFELAEGGHEEPGHEETGHDESGSQESGHEEESGHDHGAGGANEHVFYDLAVAGLVADKVAEALSEKDSANAQTYRDNVTEFDKRLDELTAQVAAIKTANPDAPVAQTEPLAYYLLLDAGLKDVTPAGLQDAVEAGQSPSARDIAATQDLLRGRQVRALIYNTQAVDEGTKALLDIANRSGVPVVDFTETLPAGTTDYIEWQKANVESLTSALASKPATP
ncbi:MAG: ABC transporter substrate-binding protein [Gordonia sp. (in: high G+C Gram-positive bacteria)]|nr:MAG: ABC transporter substrate-binding protein [Gordonia sp. (in: high G+C Gram-positive bacteria)]